jgi:hypothetical protein
VNANVADVPGVAFFTVTWAPVDVTTILSAAAQELTADTRLLASVVVLVLGSKVTVLPVQLFEAVAAGIGVVPTVMLPAVPVKVIAWVTLVLLLTSRTVPVPASWTAVTLGSAVPLPPGHVLKQVPAIAFTRFVALVEALPPTVKNRTHRSVPVQLPTLDSNWYVYPPVPKLSVSPAVGVAVFMTTSLVPAELKVVVVDPPIFALATVRLVAPCRG